MFVRIRISKEIIFLGPPQASTFRVPVTFSDDRDECFIAHSQPRLTFVSFIQRFIYVAFLYSYLVPGKLSTSLCLVNRMHDKITT
jgi:hypothetical protein